VREELDRARRTLISASTTWPRSVLAAAALGGTFGLGLLAGGIGEARGASPAGQDPLVAARARAEQLAQRQGELRLAYPAELLAPEPEASAKPAAVLVDKPASAPPAQEKAVSLTPAPTAAPVKQPQAERPKAERPEEDAAALAKPLEAEAEPAHSDSKERPSIQATLAKVLGGAPPAAATPPAQKPKTFALQVASLPERGAADALADKLAGQGLNARVVVGEVGGRTVYRVRVGSFAERDKAEAAKGKLSLPSFIVGE
jgi:cell division protein FtsN